MSLNDLAVDLTCESQEIRLGRDAQADHPPLSPLLGDSSYHDDHSFIGIEDILKSIPGSYPGFLDNTVSGPSPSTPHFSISGDSYQVHGGIHKMAVEMGGVGRPVWLVVNDALKRNPSYDLVLCGHSLGAGLCTMFGLVNSPYTMSTLRITPPLRCGQILQLVALSVKVVYHWVVGYRSMRSLPRTCFTWSTIFC